MKRRVRKGLLVAHIIASVALLGEVWVLTVLNIVAAQASDLGLAQSAYELMGTLVFAGGIPLSMLGLVTGVLLALVGHWGITKYAWVIVKLLLLLSVIFAGMLLFQPASQAAALASGSGTASQQWLQVAVVGGQTALLVVATVLAVFKPGGRIRWPWLRQDSA